MTRDRCTHTAGVCDHLICPREAARTPDPIATLAGQWTSIGASAVVDHNRRVSADGHRATMAMLARTGGVR